MNYSYGDDDELLINGMQFKDFLVTMELKIQDLEYNVQNQQWRIDSLQSDITMVESKLSEQTLINNNFVDLINYSMNADMFYYMSLNFAKKTIAPHKNKLDGYDLIYSASMVASTLLSSVNYGDEAYSLEYWSLIFEKAIELGIENSQLEKCVLQYASNVSRNASHTICGFNINKHRPKFASFLQRRYNYHDVCSMFMSLDSDKKCLSRIIMGALCRYYRIEYVNYVFKQWDYEVIKEHYHQINGMKCEYIKDAYYKNLYTVVSKKSNGNHKKLHDDNYFIKNIRNECSRIDNYFKIKNQ